MIKKVPINSKANLINAFNNIWKKGNSTNMKNIIIPIPKIGKDPNKISNFRSIVLSSCSTKLFENIIRNRIEWFSNIINNLHSTHNKDLKLYKK